MKSMSKFNSLINFTDIGAWPTLWRASEILLLYHLESSTIIYSKTHLNLFCEPLYLIYNKIGFLPNYDRRQLTYLSDFSRIECNLPTWLELNEQLSAVVLFFMREPVRTLSEYLFGLMESNPRVAFTISCRYIKMLLYYWASGFIYESTNAVILGNRRPVPPYIS